MDSEFVSARQACEILGYTRGGLQKRIENGDLTIVPSEEVPPEQRVPWGRHYLRRSDLLDPRPRHEKLGWITPEQAAGILGLSVNSMQYYRRMGYLTSLHLPDSKHRKGTFHYFDPAEVIHLRDNPPPKHLTEYPYSPSLTDSVYLAALIDGEGTVIIRLARYPHQDRYGLQVAVSNTYEPVLRWAEETFGGKTALIVRTRADWRPCYRWVVSGTTAYHVLTRVEPFMKIKHAQTRIALEFQERMLQYKAGRWKRLESTEQDWREEQRQKISALNQQIYTPIP